MFSTAAKKNTNRFIYLTQMFGYFTQPQKCHISRLLTLYSWWEIANRKWIRRWRRGGQKLLTIMANKQLPGGDWRVANRGCVGLQQVCNTQTSLVFQSSCHMRPFIYIYKYHNSQNYLGLSVVAKTYIQLHGQTRFLFHSTQKLF